MLEATAGPFLPGKAMTVPISIASSQERNLVGWFGRTPDEGFLQEFYRRGFELQEVDRAMLEGARSLDAFRAVILVQPEVSSFKWLEAQLTTYSKRILANGCAFIVVPLRLYERAASQKLSTLKVPTWGFLDRHRDEFERFQGIGEPPQPYVRLFSTNMHPWVVANFAHGFDAGRRPNRDLRIETLNKSSHRYSKARFPFEQDNLLRRAFADCDVVHLKPLLDGHSDAQVFCAYPNLAKGEIGPWTQPYFVKLDSRFKIFSEYTKYQETVHPYLPFYLAPRLTNERCYLSGGAGIIVGDFVDEAEGLMDAAESGRAVPSVAGLLDRTLLAWHRNAGSDLLDFGANLRSRIEGLTVDDSRLARASGFGLVLPLKSIVEIVGSLPKAPVMVGPIHGDLHAGNVRVRHGEAVMIDFASQEVGPVLLDLARLEVSFLVDGFKRDSRLNREIPAVRLWLNSLLKLYRDRKSVV